MFSFRNKIIAGTFLIQVLLLIVLLTSVFGHLRSSNEQQLSQRAQTTGNLFASAIKDALLTRDIATLDSLVQDMASNPAVRYTRILAGDKILAEAGDAHLLREQHTLDRRLGESEAGIFNAQTAVIVAEHEIGRIQFGLDTSEIETSILNAKRWSLSIAALLVFLVTLFSMSLGQFVVRQMESIRNAATRIAEQGPGQEIPHAGQDELGSMIDAFNLMSRKLARSQQELTELAEVYRRVADMATENESFKSAILTSTLDALITTDDEGTVISCNQATAEVFGWPEQELVGIKLAESIIPQRFRQAHREGMRRYLRDGHGPVLGRRVELIALHRDGHEFPIEISISPFHIKERTYFTAFIRDITDCQRLEAELRLAATAFEVNESLLVTDADLRIVRVNGAFEKMTGYSEREALGKNPKILSSGQQDGDFYQRMWHKINTQGYWQGELFNRRKNGEIYAAEVNITAALDPSGSTTHYVAHYADISERQQHEKELRQAMQRAEEANMAKSRFLATMSHEIRTPLNAVIGMTSLLLETPLNSEQQDYVKVANNGGRTLLDLVNDILDFSKIEANLLKLHEEWIEPQKVVSGVVELLYGQAEAKGIELVTVVHPQTPQSCYTDMVRLRQILVNLVGNAVKFTEQGGIKVDLMPVSGSAEGLAISVSDTGIGIPEAIQHSIFDEFIQAEHFETRRFGGSGLGLAITKRLIGLMGGSIRLTSDEHSGSRFLVQLPCATRNDEPAIVAEPRKVLLHIDNQVLRDGISEQLSLCGMTPLQDSPAQRQQLQGQAEVVFLSNEDLYGQHLDGLPEEWLPVTLASMYSSGAIVQAKRAGYHAVVRKPYRREQLLHYVQGHSEQQDGPPDSIRASREPTGDKMRSANILLVEDSPANQALVKAIVSKIGHRVVTADNGVEAIEASSDERFDLILMDLSMPLMGGLEATRLIRSGQGANKNTPIVAMTANAFEEDRQRCFAAGMTDHITKPLDTHRFRERLCYWLDRSTETSSDRLDAPPTDAPQPSPDELVDPQVLLHLQRETGTEMLAELGELFIAETRQRLPRMVTLAEQNNWQDLGKEAHALKSAAGSYGTMQLHDAARQLEASVATGARELLQPFTQSIVELADRSLRQLQQAIERLKN